MTNAPERDAINTQVGPGQALIDQIRTKMNKIVDEFAQGEISREQFNQIYEHYQAQIVMAMQVSDTNLTDGALGSPKETIALRNALTGKAKAMTVYYHATGLLLETLGDFDVSVARIAPELNKLSASIQEGQKVPPRSDKQGDQWLLYVPGRFSTAVMLFSNEPSARQINIVENLHRDFEVANEVALRSGQADGTTLVYPFQLFVRRSMRK
jgi:hypothetical protein